VRLSAHELNAQNFGGIKRPTISLINTSNVVKLTRSTSPSESITGKKKTSSPIVRLKKTTKSIDSEEFVSSPESITVKTRKQPRIGGSVSSLENNSTTMRGRKRVNASPDSAEITPTKKLRMDKSNVLNPKVTPVDPSLTDEIAMINYKDSEFGDHITKVYGYCTSVYKKVNDTKTALVFLSQPDRERLNRYLSKQKDSFINLILSKEPDALKNDALMRLDGIAKKLKDIEVEEWVDEAIREYGRLEEKLWFSLCANQHVRSRKAALYASEGYRLIMETFRLLEKNQSK